ncbi:hypothetical protein JW930_05265 [Candidatus Woesearchaeota archaeon]|nr:hypothetical protein [Candidatus Woesearchaeota archaeon]
MREPEKITLEEEIKALYPWELLYVAARLNEIFERRVRARATGESLMTREDSITIINITRYVLDLHHRRKGDLDADGKPKLGLLANLGTSDYADFHQPLSLGDDFLMYRQLLAFFASLPSLGDWFPPSSASEFRTQLDSFKQDLTNHRLWNEEYFQPWVWTGNPDLPSSIDSSEPYWQRQGQLAYMITLGCLVLDSKWLGDYLESRGKEVVKYVNDAEVLFEEPPKSLGDLLLGLFTHRHYFALAGVAAARDDKSLLLLIEKEKEGGKKEEVYQAAAAVFMTCVNHFRRKTCLSIEFDVLNGDGTYIEIARDLLDPEKSNPYFTASGKWIVLGPVRTESRGEDLRRRGKNIVLQPEVRELFVYLSRMRPQYVALYASAVQYPDLYKLLSPDEPEGDSSLAQRVLQWVKSPESFDTRKKGELVQNIADSGILGLGETVRVYINQLNLLAQMYQRLGGIRCRT